jgi:hypothetical protein
MKWGMGSGKTFGGLYTALSVYEKCVVMVTLSSISTQYFNEVCSFMASSKIPVYLLTSKNDKFFKGINVISINTLDGMLRVDSPWIERIVTKDTVNYINENFQTLFCTLCEHSMSICPVFCLSCEYVWYGCVRYARQKNFKKIVPGEMSRLIVDAMVIDEMDTVSNWKCSKHQTLQVFSKICRNIIGTSGTPYRNSIADIRGQLSILMNYGRTSAVPRVYDHFPIHTMTDYDVQDIFSAIVSSYDVKLAVVASYIVRGISPDGIDKPDDVVYHRRQKLYEELLGHTTQDDWLRAFRNCKLCVPDRYECTSCLVPGVVSCATCVMERSLVSEGALDTSNKFTEVARLIEKHKDRKVIVFSSFPVCLHAFVVFMVRRKNFSYYDVAGDDKIGVIDGMTSEREREKIRKVFYEDPTFRVLAASTKTTGTGLNITCASITILLDCAWNHGTIKQAHGRSHRIGQSQNTFCYILIAENSIDEAQMRIVEDKSINNIDFDSRKRKFDKGEAGIVSEHVSGCISQLRDINCCPSLETERGHIYLNRPTRNVGRVDSHLVRQ